MSKLSSIFSAPKLSEEQRNAFDRLENSHRNFFITGKAGTGKSVLLQYFVAHTKKKVAVTAPTGVAALNVHGQTIHSLFTMSLGFQDVEDDKMVTDLPEGRKRILRSIDTLIIDEVSMVSADIMDMIDHKLRRIRDRRKPFGGVQVIMFGDLFQLPPVSYGAIADMMIDRYDTCFFFGSSCIRDHIPEIIELNHVFRQNDTDFINLLNEVRVGNNSKHILDTINDCYIIPPEDAEYITLTGNNRTAYNINMQNLDALDGDIYTFEGESSGNINIKDIPAEEELQLKLGARIMMVKNHIPAQGEKQRWVNGSIGIISDISDDYIEVKINGKKYPVGKERWEKTEYYFNKDTSELEQRETGVFKQYPIRLAYAITIHKSQGQTYDSVKIHLGGGAFAAGQTYVALSRCKSLDKLYLEAPIQAKDIISNQEVKDFLDYARNNPEEVLEQNGLF